MNKIFTYNEAFEASKKYFSGDELAAKVWVNKYALKDSKGNIYELDPDDMHWRLAKEIARIENKYPNPLTKEEVFELFSKFKYIVPQGGPMTGIGNNFQISSLSNCFVIGLDKQPDSYGGIMKIDEEQIQLMKRRGGVGHDLSHIRPLNAHVSNAALTSSGVASFMERYSNSTREVGQGGRRGALMLSLSINHPDSDKFIDAKMTEGKVTGANVSVKIDDDFMSAVINRDKYVQKFPIYSDNPNFHKSVDAQELWKKIIHNAWKSAEPGVLFWDTIIKESIPDCYADLGFKTASTNPCVTGDTTLLTRDGFKPIMSLIGQEINIWNGYEWSKVTPFKTSDNAKVYKVKFSDGSELKCTNYHKFILKGNNRKELQDVHVGDKLQKFNFPILFANNENDNTKGYYTLGFYSGDGSILKRDNRDVQYIIDLYGKKKGLIDHLVCHKYGNYLEDQDRQRVIISDLLPEPIDKSYVPNESVSVNNRLAWLVGIIDSDGTRNDNSGSISISSNNWNYLFDIKTMLITLGVHSVLSICKEKCDKEIKGSIYHTDTNYRLSISASNMIRLKSLGLITYRVDTFSTPNRNASQFITIESIEYYGEEATYCVTEPKNHSALFNHVMTGQCGEIPLCPYDSCRLIALNLYSYVTNPFTDQANFDIDLFEKHVRLALRIMDDIIDLEIEKIDQIIKKIKSDPEDNVVKNTELDLWEKIKAKCLVGRRTGVGITAEGDMLAALGYTYGTDAANDFSETVHKIIAINTYSSSVNLAKERGAFSIYNSDLEKDNPFIKRIAKENPELYEAMKKYGRRNIACLTIAPTGTTSLMTQTTSGIEPVFLPIYKRRRKVNPNDQDVRVDFIDEVSDSFEEYLVIHPKFKTWMDIKGISIKDNCSKEEIESLVAISPYYRATSNDIDWIQKVRMQGKIQKWVDHSISVTINLPANASEELVSELYIEAWKCGCKGCTVYRDGSRSGIMIPVDKKKESRSETDKKKRPYSLQADVVRFKHNSENWLAFVGILNGRPYEIFTGILDEDEGIMIPKSIKKGEILKEKGDDGQKHYRFVFKNKAGIKMSIDGLEKKFSSEFWNYAKFISVALRYEMPIEKVVSLIQNLEWNNETINNWRNGVIRALKKYIPNGLKAKDQTCPNCGQETLVFQEGCLICTNCGSSKCG